ncbi:Ribosomal RNA small subunit methyltransferase G [Tepidimonas alkaliphilus]|uniref:Ribosomal RNA small subunit methyltransferase G n=1 Tax=Tepidimonas alkaliphilus TaxID=2588942 RepID=A0A554W7S9_9BURK|nr:16S rRNA (guanine(527)-N(7))-methyltransferase RsmG [Tepidimonas alkaliphilus]TSE19633.1 Ribosomal RNA small subunit methyltransferase G [Tepidimonas alkaliphilus]
MKASEAQRPGALAAGLHALGLTLDEAAQRRLLDYLALLQRWNAAINLTALRDPAQMLTRHLLDSLAVLRPLRRELAARGCESAARILDVGSGAGLPGVVLAIAEPRWQVVCVDAAAKKTAFVTQAAATLALPNLRAVHARVQELDGPFDVVTARAFATLADFVTWSRPALAPEGVWMAMKGRVPHDEIAALPSWAEAFHVEPLTVPGLNAERCLVWLRRRGDDKTP